jgi:hypothetical protein
MSHMKNSSFSNLYVKETYIRHMSWSPQCKKID